MFKVYMTQGQGEVLVGEFETRDAAEVAVKDGHNRGDGSYWLAAGTAQNKEEMDKTIPF